ncbi:4-hydroxythreonine-4-phosphate dehydrogenase PdxA [Phaeovulum vinaykumarii]|uniref:4-hydroxythreonine-4-phosphate dehydrogenase n=1 Tax=Phaeovulum vinaykumarii TaxID=407234 RepID=A0A1N7K4N5_9RHOB|nr:4-hydroxythreonine-4-phosphate dehydrogenase PdxA [Phaeovulum vinaykumarii]SIS56520.1 4-hydroxythreonine-4-phosphate dehydrogenase [Phaeovulum vinaykumarii]SOB92907.1 4-hydroxythreonine-4-phosphate dehydrogenase [Phaeovulum vinaykumarii]
MSRVSLSPDAAPGWAPDRSNGVVLVSCGEPAGVGPEIAAKAWAARGADLPFVYLGDPAHLPAGTPFVRVSEPAEAPQAARHGLPVLPHPFPDPAEPGRPSAANATEVIAVIARAVDLIRQGAAGALCTAPIHKHALQSGAGFAFPGHTEYLAHLAGDVPVVMMLASSCVAPGLRVVPATIHIALSEVPRALTPALLEQVIRITHAGLRRDFALAAPRLALAGLNPHAGEDGAMGPEEIAWIAPLAGKLRAEGMDLAGPLPPDTMFHPAARARYDAAICAYHDQALIPIKTLDFAGGVNLTLGLPFVRTSPDHGTAFNIAGRGIADPASMLAALEMARDLARRRATGRAA